MKLMESGLSFHSREKGFFAFLVSAVFCTALSSVNAQGTRTWSDGAPAFSRIDSTSAVQIDSTAHLLAIEAISSTPDTFSLNLSGDAGTYNTGSVPLDFSRVPFAADLYIVADGFGREVFVIRAIDGGRVAEFKGSASQPEAMNNPVSARAFSSVENGTDVRRVLVADSDGNRVIIFDYDTRLVTWDFTRDDTRALDGALLEPRAAVPVPGLPEILVCDTGNKRILRIDTRLSRIIDEFGTELEEPVDIELDDDRIAVVDKARHVVFIYDAETLIIERTIGTLDTPGSGDRTLSSPEDVQLLPNGNLLIADTGNNRLIEVDSTGTIVWRFLGDLPGLVSVNRLQDGRTLVISNNKLRRLGYSTELIELEKIDLGKEVTFDSLSWQVDLPAGTDIRFQMRAANILSDLDSAPWLGPSGENSFYTADSQAINPLHSGLRFYQLRTELITDAFLLTPVLSRVQVHFHFFDTDTTGLLTSAVISDSAGLIITRWDELFFETVIPDDPSTRDDVQLEVRVIDAETGEILQSFPASKTATTNQFALSEISRLRSKQRIRLQARMETTNSSVSPALKSWQITWQNAVSADAEITFTDQDRVPVFAYRLKRAAEAGADPPGSIFVTLRDNNIIDVLNAVEVELTANNNGDRETLLLEKRANGEYRSDTGMQAVIQEFVGVGNGILELQDRDSLIVRYVDPTTPTDIATDTALVLQQTRAQLIVEDQRGPIADSTRISFLDTLYLRVVGEFDRDFTPEQDTIYAEFFDNVTSDIEELMLLEVPTTAGDTVYTTGEFFSTPGLPLARTAVGTPGDGRLQTLPNSEIGARYIDIDTATVVLRMAASDTLPPEVIGSGAFSFILAPNPYRVGQGVPMRMRMEAYTGSLILEKVDIFTLDGTLVQTIPATGFNMDNGTTIPAKSRSTTRTQWWDMKHKNGSNAGSGTYFARFSGTFRDANGQSEKITFLRKFVIVR